jgi:hypothetical protein
MRRFSVFEWPFGQAFNTTLFAVVYTWLNTRKSRGFGFIQGFPFVYTGFEDAAPNFYFSGMALLENLVIGSVLAALIWRFVPRGAVKCHWNECLMLGIIASAFTWANLEDWYGWRPTIWSVMHSETISNGFPVAYSVVVKHGGEQGFFHPWLDSVNWLILCVTLAAVSKLYHRRQAAAQHPAGAER